MRPKILLSLACEKIVLPSGDALIKRLAVSGTSCNLFVYMYWFVHCRFFQGGNECEQEYLLGKVAVIYTGLLSLKSLESHKDFFFKHYPFILSQSIILGFRYLCPGNQSLFTSHFKRILYHEVTQILSGCNVCPVSVNVLRGKLFPEELLEQEEDVEEPLPPITSFSSSRIEEDVSPKAMLMGADNTGNGLISQDDGEVELLASRKKGMNKSAR